MHTRTFFKHLTPIFYFATKMQDYETMAFKNALEWRQWLDKNNKKCDGVWLQIYKKQSSIISVTYDEALDEGLCFGWIDGQRKKYDEDSYLQKFTPRRSNSMWSKRNIENIARLTAENKLTPAGQAEVERAKNDGRWEASYDSQKNMVIPEDFIDAVKQSKKAYNFYKTLSKTNLFAISMQLQTAKKPETRAKRFSKLLEMLKNQEKPV